MKHDETKDSQPRQHGKKCTTCTTIQYLSSNWKVIATHILPITHLNYEDHTFKKKVARTIWNACMSSTASLRLWCSRSLAWRAWGKIIKRCFFSVQKCPSKSYNRRDVDFYPPLSGLILLRLGDSGHIILGRLIMRSTDTQDILILNPTGLHVNW